MRNRIHVAGLLAAIAASALLAACEPPPVNTVQRGYRGTGMIEVYRPAAIEAAAAINTPPPMSPPASADGPRASQVFKNVKVLGDLSAGQFAQIMVDMTAWVAPQQGCTYCHAATDFSDDSLYTKVVARRMLQMTQHINADWKRHVADTGVTCYTCHRGNNVPSNIWYRSAESAETPGLLGNRAGQNAPAPQVGLTSLPNDPFSTFLGTTDEIRVVSTSALPDGARPSLIKNTEATYGLMIHMSQSLGVNCTYCHNSRSFASWEMSTPQRATAYYGIRHGPRSRQQLPRLARRCVPRQPPGADRRRAEAQLRDLPPGRVQTALWGQHPEWPPWPDGWRDDGCGRCRHAAGTSAFGFAGAARRGCVRSRCRSPGTDRGGRHAAAGRVQRDSLRRHPTNEAAVSILA